jgi:RHS repeat-associated protein
VAETRFTGGTASSVYLHSNWRGDVVMATDESGTVIGEYSYTTFGEQLSAVDTYTPRFTFSSKERDAAGLVYFGFRYYSPILCRWINEDPIRESGGINLYQFCGNNPVNGIDTDGKSWGAVVLVGLAAWGGYQGVSSAIEWWKTTNRIKDIAETRRHGDWLCDYGAEHGDVDVYNAGIQELHNSLYLAATGVYGILNTPGTTLTGPPPFVDIPLTRNPATPSLFAPLSGRPGYQRVNGYNRADGTYVPPYYRRPQGSDMPRPDNNLYSR